VENVFLAELAPLTEAYAPQLSLRRRKQGEERRRQHTHLSHYLEGTITWNL